MDRDDAVLSSAQYERSEAKMSMNSVIGRHDMAVDREQVMVTRSDNDEAVVTYTPPADYVGPDSLVVTVAENQRHGGTAGTGVVIDAGGGFSNSVIDIQAELTRLSGNQA